MSNSWTFAARIAKGSAAQASVIAALARFHTQRSAIDMRACQDPNERLTLRASFTASTMMERVLKRPADTSGAPTVTRSRRTSERKEWKAIERDTGKPCRLT